MEHRSGPPEFCYAIDFDSKEAWEWFQQRIGRLPKTLTTITSRGRHLYFWIGKDYKNKRILQAQPIDLKGGRMGYVLGDGSVVRTRSGNRTYTAEWHAIAEAPKKIEHFLRGILRVNEDKLSPKQRILRRLDRLAGRDPFDGRNHLLFNRMCEYYGSPKKLFTRVTLRTAMSMNHYDPDDPIQKHFGKWGRLHPDEVRHIVAHVRDYQKEWREKRRRELEARSINGERGGIQSGISRRLMHKGRDEMIHAKYASGMSQVAIGLEFGISHQQIHNILKRDGKL